MNNEGMNVVRDGVMKSVYLMNPSRNGPHKKKQIQIGTILDKFLGY